MSDWRERANKRRDERQTKVPNIRAPNGSRKDTKRWCRGVVGREHKPVCVSYNELKHSDASYPKEWRVLVCETCRREMDYYWPSPFHLEPVQKPDWVK